MPDINLQDLAILRIIVGYLGEKEQFGWWSSSFFSSSSEAFLSPVFPRTQLLAQTTGVSKAATLLHDERIGIGQVFHLFRLPEEMAQGIHQALQEQDLKGKIEPLITSKKNAIDFLKDGVEIPASDEVGPVHVGDRDSLYDGSRWDVVRAYYAKAFSEGKQIFPYFSGKRQ